jgi:hypothetical protein
VRENADAGRNSDAVPAVTAVLEDRLPELHEHVAPFERRGGVRKRLQLREGGGHVLVPEADILIGRRPQGARVARGQAVLAGVVDDDPQVLLGELDGVGLRRPFEVVAAPEVEHDPAVDGDGAPSQKGEGRKHEHDGPHCFSGCPVPSCVPNDLALHSINIIHTITK